MAAAAPSPPPGRDVTRKPLIRPAGAPLAESGGRPVQSASSPASHGRGAGRAAGETRGSRTRQMSGFWDPGCVYFGFSTPPGGDGPAPGRRDRGRAPEPPRQERRRPDPATGAEVCSCVEFLRRREEAVEEERRHRG
nr:PREDICTED: uncharacterized protein LOC107075415 isoform X1 [Lepisosteus oculatus]